MRRLVVLVLVATLLSTTELVLAAAPPASAEEQAQVVPRKKKVKQRAGEWVRMYGVVRLRGHEITDVDHTSSEPLGRTDTVAAARTSYACVKRTRGRRVIAFRPLLVRIDGNSFTHRWILFVYQANRARKVEGRRTKQFEFCATGSGHTWNDWNADFNGAGLSLKDRPDIRIGQNWGERVSDDGGIHSTLGFELGAGVAKVSASTPVGIDDHHHFTGTQGRDPRIYVPAHYVDANQVNSYYEAGDTWTFQGTDREAGNNLHALYEVRQRARGGLSFVLSTRIHGHCTKWFQVLGRRCESFD